MLSSPGNDAETGIKKMYNIGRYRIHAEALLTISRKFRELSTVDADNSHLLEECAEGLSAMAEALVVEAQGAAARPAVLH